MLFLDVKITRGGVGGSFPGGSVVKNSPANTGDWGSIPGPGRSPGGGNSNLSCWDSPMDKGAWGATVQEVTKSQAQLTDWAHTLT